MLNKKNAQNWSSVVTYQLPGRFQLLYSRATHTEVVKLSGSCQTAATAHGNILRDSQFGTTFVSYAFSEAAIKFS